MEAAEYDRGLAIKNLTKISGPLDMCYDLWIKAAEVEFGEWGNHNAVSLGNNKNSNSPHGPGALSTVPGIPYPGYPIYTPPPSSSSSSDNTREPGTGQKLIWPNLPFFSRLKICWLCDQYHMAAQYMGGLNVALLAHPLVKWAVEAVTAFQSKDYAGFLKDYYARADFYTACSLGKCAAYARICIVLQNLRVY